MVASVDLETRILQPQHSEQTTNVSRKKNRMPLSKVFSSMVASVLALSMLSAAQLAAAAELRLAGVFGDHMVLQREKPITIWGWGEVGTEVRVTFADQTSRAKVDAGGRWQVVLNPMATSHEARELVCSSRDKQITVRDVVVGEVWLASGQSNMAMTLKSVADRLTQAQDDIRAADHSSLRFRRIDEPASREPVADIPPKSWTVCSPTTAGSFSAAAYYFASKLQRELDVPVGIIDSSRGGTPIEPFIPREAFQGHPTLEQELALGDREDLLGIWKLAGGVRARDANWLPGRLFHSRLAPMKQFAVRGAIWYQGESNCGIEEDPRDYQHKMRGLIQGWRDAFGNPSMPVYFVQLPGSGASPNWPYLREQQRLSCNLPHTGMVVTIDLLDGDIHPPNKIDVGDRLARWALAGPYEKKLTPSGPLFDRVEIDDSKVIVHFQYAESGLMFAEKQGLDAPVEKRDGKLSHFELADAEGVWHPADATIVERSVVVQSKAVPRPVAVRYGYELSPQHCHLYNRDGLPAAPFCSNPKLLTEPVIRTE